HLGLTSSQARERAVELLDMVRIPDARSHLKDYPHQLSGGMMQRVMIAIAISCRPQVLIADEPTTALDVTIQAQIIDMVKQLREELGMSIIWITHDLGVVAGLVDRVAVMYAGYLVEQARVRDLYQNPRHPYTLGLLRSLPRLDVARRKRLIPIQGIPPDLTALPRGCPFYARCPYRTERCRTVRPMLREVSEGHRVACWVDVRQPEVRR
ncbi:MAG: ABC transporter ATP-binding protein, partial [Anaerolineae bacterium]